MSVPRESSLVTVVLIGWILRRGHCTRESRHGFVREIWSYMEMQSPPFSVTYLEGRGVWHQHQESATGPLDDTREPSMSLQCRILQTLLVRHDDYLDGGQSRLAAPHSASTAQFSRPAVRMKKVSMISSPKCYM